MKSDKMGSVMMSSVKYKGMYQFDPIKGMPAGHMKNEQFFVISINVENQSFDCSRDSSNFSRLQGLSLALVLA